MAKLTPTQMAALSAMPFECTTWGGKPISRPKDAGTQATWGRLRMLGFAKCERRKFTDYWQATEAGRAMIDKKS